MSEDTDHKGRGTEATRGGRPTLPLEARRTERISFGVTKAQKAAFLVNAAQAGLSSNDFARDVLCDHGARAGIVVTRAPDFELVDTLARIGADLARLRHIADETNVVPPGLAEVTARLDRKLDHLIVGTRLADELAQYRGRLADLEARLDSRGGMTDRARGMIRTFDAVVTKVLSASSRVLPNSGRGLSAPACTTCTTSATRAFRRPRPSALRRRNIS